MKPPAPLSVTVLCTAMRLSVVVPDCCVSVLVLPAVFLTAMGRWTY